RNCAWMGRPVMSAIDNQGNNPFRNSPAAINPLLDELLRLDSAYWRSSPAGDALLITFQGQQEAALLAALRLRGREFAENIYRLQFFGTSTNPGISEEHGIDFLLMLRRRLELIAQGSGGSDAARARIDAFIEGINQYLHKQCPAQGPGGNTYRLHLEVQYQV